MSSSSPLPTLVAREGFTRPKRHPVSGYEYGRELALGIGRYSTAINSLWEQLIEAMLCDPAQLSDDPVRGSV